MEKPSFLKTGEFTVRRIAGLYTRYPFHVKSYTRRRWRGGTRRRWRSGRAQEMSHAEFAEDAELWLRRGGYLTRRRGDGGVGFQQRRRDAECRVRWLFGSAAPWETTFADIADLARGFGRCACGADEPSALRHAETMAQRESAGDISRGVRGERGALGVAPARRESAEDNLTRSARSTQSLGVWLLCASVALSLCV